MAKEIKKKDNKKEDKVAKSSANVKGIRSELKKVTWPTGKELVNSTTAVIIIVILTAIIVFFLDVVFESLSTYGINKLRTTVSDKVNNEVTTTQDVNVDNEVSPTIEGEVTENTEAENQKEATDVSGETPAEGSTVEE